MPAYAMLPLIAEAREIEPFVLKKDGWDSGKLSQALARASNKGLLREVCPQAMQGQAHEHEPLGPEQDEDIYQKASRTGKPLRWLLIHKEEEALPENGRVVTVLACERLRQFAQRQGTKCDTICQINKLDPRAWVYPGQQLIVTDDAVIAW